METKKPILSICLPTNGAVQWVIPTLRSVYEQGVDKALFEVVITDNGEDSQLAEALIEFNYSNLRYIKTQDKGFLNLVTCLQMGNGLFCKMLNHRMVLLPGMLQKMIDFVNRYKDDKPVIYFLNGNGKLPNTTECNNIDEFVYAMNLWVSWSAGIGFWDIDKIKLSSIEPNEMFPNTSLLFEHRLDSKYIIWNEIYGKMQDDSGKGGYDLFHTFGVVLNDLLLDLCKKKRITNTTFKYVKRTIFIFIQGLYYREVLRSKKSNHNYIIHNIRKSISEYYGLSGYYYIVVREILVLIKNVIRKISITPSVKNPYPSHRFLIFFIIFAIWQLTIK